MPEAARSVAVDLHEPREARRAVVVRCWYNLDNQVKEGKFREDLYYRLYGIALEIPALRERRDDILALADSFVEDLADPNAPRASLSPAARDKLHAYDWPGNVRQLRNIIHRALVMAKGPEIGPEEIDLRERESRPTMPVLRDEPEELRARAEDAEKKKILDALDECAGNQTRAAQLLGITRRVLVRKLEKFNVPRPRRDRATPDDDPEPDE